MKLLEPGAVEDKDGEEEDSDTKIMMVMIVMQIAVSWAPIAR